MRIKETFASACLAMMLLSGSTATAARGGEILNGGKSGSSGSSSASSQGGQCNVNVTEKRCVNNPEFGKEFADTIYDNMKNKRPGGYCLRGVRQSLQESCDKGSTSWGCAEAEDATACFAKLGFIKKEGEPPKDADFKPGTVFIYAGDDKGGGPGAGHIEAYTGTQLNGKPTYCSDFCTNNRADLKRPTTRPLLGWYEPPSANANVAAADQLKARYSAIAFLFDAR